LHDAFLPFFSFLWSLCYFRVRISKIWKNCLSRAGQVLDIPDKWSSTIVPLTLCSLWFYSVERTTPTNYLRTSKFRLLMQVSKNYENSLKPQQFDSLILRDVILVLTYHFHVILTWETLGTLKTKTQNLCQLYNRNIFEKKFNHMKIVHL
jgi:hypothetical protein